MSKVYVVFCMDTEGPCDDPNNDELLKTWSDVDQAMDKLFDSSYRHLYPDSSGGGLRIGWFFLTWSGFITNPRGRDFGYHRVRDHFITRWGGLINEYEDEECWHYHHPPRSGIGNEWSTDWLSSDEYKFIISRQIIERNWFPVCFRAGGTIMGPELSEWVDRWFPFDYSNRAPLKFSEMDWSGGVIDWQPYRPGARQFKRKGNGKRYMARCMDLQTGLYKTGRSDVCQAFDQALQYGSSILSVFDHDYRDIADRIAEFMSCVEDVAKLYPDVSWEYSSPSNAIVQSQGCSGSESLNIDLTLNGKCLSIVASSPIYQEYPWVALRDEKGRIHHIESNIQIVDGLTWEVDINPDISIDVIGVAASNVLGGSCISTVKPLAK